MKLELLFAVFVCLALAAAPVQAAKGLTLVNKGKSDYTIVLPKDASLSEKHAAAELQRFIGEISDTKLPIVTEPTQSNKNIVLGASGVPSMLALNVNPNSLGDEGFVIATIGDDLIIAGGKLRGTMYGVYTFLEDVLGCRWYTSAVSKIPKKKTIRIPALDIVQKPDFEYREPYYTDAWDADWAARNKVNGNKTELDDTRGGKIAYNGFCHTFDGLMPTDKYFKDHPEYHSLDDKGVRVGGQYSGQLCLTNPDVVRLVTEAVLQRIAEHPELRIISVTQNDNPIYCRCPNCAAVDAEEGSPSGLMLRFVNQVADEVAKKYPNHLIDTFAYWYTEKPCKITKPHANVRVRLCPIGNCQYHPYEDPSCPTNKAFMETLKGWHEKTNNVMYIWHYNTHFGAYLLPLPDLDELTADVPMYKRYGVVGVFFQGTYTAGNGPYGGGGWMDDLKQYLLAKLAWNAKTDAKAVINDFLTGYYGKAGKPIGEFLELIHNRVRSGDLHSGVFQGIDGSGFMADYLLPSYNAKFDEAEKLAATPDELRRVKHARLSIRFVEVYRQAKKAATGTLDEKRTAIAALRKFRKNCEADGIVNSSEGGRLADWYEGLAAPLRR